MQFIIVKIQSIYHQFDSSPTKTTTHRRNNKPNKPNKTKRTQKKNERLENKHTATAALAITLPATILPPVSCLTFCVQSENKKRTNETTQKVFGSARAKLKKKRECCVTRSCRSCRYLIRALMRKYSMRAGAQITSKHTSSARENIGGAWTWTWRI